MERHNDAVNTPSHYAGGTSIECIDSMLAVLGIDGVIDFCLGNAYKYLWRHKLKGRPEEDLEKADWYIHRASLLNESYVEPVDERQAHDNYNKLSGLMVMYNIYSCLANADKALHKKDDISNEVKEEKKDEFDAMLEALSDDYDKDFKISPDEVSDIISELEIMADAIDAGGVNASNATTILLSIKSVGAILDKVADRG